MTEPALALSVLRAGARLAIQYNPLAAAASAALAAALAGSPRARRVRLGLPAAVLVAGWLIGDGFHVLYGPARRMQDITASAVSPAWAGVALTAIWAAGSFALGYVGPTVLGATVGRRVRHGTGRLSAAAVASAVTLALAAVVAGLA